MIAPDPDGGTMIPAFSSWRVGRDDLSPGSKLDPPAERQLAQSNPFLDRFIETVELQQLPFFVDHGYKAPPLAPERLRSGSGIRPLRSTRKGPLSRGRRSSPALPGRSS